MHAHRIETPADVKQHERSRLASIGVGEEVNADTGNEDFWAWADLPGRGLIEAEVRCVSSRNLLRGTIVVGRHCMNMVYHLGPSGSMKGTTNREFGDGHDLVVSVGAARTPADRVHHEPAPRRIYSHV